MSEQISYLDHPPKIITFDCYGTLVQGYEVLAREIDVTLRKLGVTDVSATAIIESFSAQGRHLTAKKPHRLYKDILRIGFAAAFAEHGLTPSKDEIERIASSPTKMGPHPASSSYSGTRRQGTPPRCGRLNTSFLTVLWIQRRRLFRRSMLLSSRPMKQGPGVQAEV
ncbi:HAD family hydrolase [Oryzicola mucosus]|uniref:Uncharacterized protein n=1 Tax=Oryzicola mucosus TaxID=2767425 RepID=A0A8J6U560_9HYPH|nr:hypothetical protein [Oryzicola mucosus]MBD0415630.1 hypothetical protein [Oryzicola mucosus]